MMTVSHWTAHHHFLTKSKLHHCKKFVVSKWMLRQILCFTNIIIASAKFMVYCLMLEEYNTDISYEGFSVSITSIELMIR